MKHMVNLIQYEIYIWLFCIFLFLQCLPKFLLQLVVEFGGVKSYMQVLTVQVLAPLTLMLFGGQL